MVSNEFKNYVYKLAKELEVFHKIKSIHLRKMKTKVASCSNKGVLSFDIDILKFPHTKQKEIIIHELLHLKYKNHGKLFKIMSKILMKKL